MIRNAYPLRGEKMSHPESNHFSCIRYMLPVLLLSMPLFGQSSEDKITVFFAEFSGPDPVVIPVTESLFSWFSSKGVEDETFSTVRLNEIIEVTGTFDENFGRFQQDGADLVVYGVYDMPGTHARVVISVASTAGITAGQVIHIHFDLEGTFPLSELIPGSDPPDRINFLIDMLTGYAYLSRDDFENALLCLNRSLDRVGMAPDDMVALAYSLRGLANRNFGDTNAALEDADLAIELDPETHLHFTYRGGILETMGEVEAAIDDYLTVNELDPLNPENLYNMSRMYRLLGEYDNAIECISSAILLVPDEPCYLNTRGYIYIYMEEYVAAAEDIYRSLEIDTSYPTGWANLGCALREMGDIEEAIDSFTNALHFQQDVSLDASYYIDRGYCFELLGDYESAISDFEAGIECFQASSTEHAYLGWLHMQVEDYSSAITSYNNALQLNENNSELLSKRGYCNYMLSERQAAINDFNESLRLDPDGFDEYEHLGKAYAEENDYESAIHYFEEGYDHSTIPEEQSWFLSYICRCYLDILDHESSLTAALNAVQLNPSEPYFHFQLGDSYYMLDREYEAIECYDDAIEMGLTHEYMWFCSFRRGRSHLIIGNTDQAIEDLTTAMAYEPGWNDADAYYFRGKAHFENGDFDLCREDMEHYIERGVDPSLLLNARRYLSNIGE